VARKVVVDDLLPADKNGRLMCTFSMNKSEFWPSIIEKAYMKLMGGYNFPGSHSSIDLHTLTGWIPEQISLKDAKNETFKRLFDGNRFGDVLITISTGRMTPEEEEQRGLVPNHAYAVLDVREIKEIRLLQVKNPWAHKRWKGDYSHLDAKNWTPELKLALNYDQLSEMEKDNGIFWISWESVLKVYENIDLSWNPTIFNNRFVLHDRWNKYDGPKKDHYNVGYNPQFAFQVNAEMDNLPVWLLLTKHITKKEENKDFISLLVFKNEKKEFSRVYYPNDAFIQGIYINSPHYLVRFNAPKGLSRYVLVVSQYEKLNDLKFTVLAYSMASVSFRELEKFNIYEEKVNGEWNSESAGGHSAKPLFFNNPAFRIQFLPTTENTPLKVILFLEAPKVYSGNIRLFRMPSSGIFDRSQGLLQNDIANSGNYRPGFSYVELTNIEGNDFVAMVSTFEEGQVGPFFFTVGSNRKFKITKLPLEGEGMHKKVIKGFWQTGVNSYGSANLGQYDLNQKYFLSFKGTSSLIARLLAPEINPTPSLNIALFESGFDNPRFPNFGKEVANSGN